MATKLTDDYGLPYSTMQLIKSDPNLKSAFTPFNQTATPAMTTGALKVDDLISLLRGKTSAGPVNPGIKSFENNANGQLLKTKEYKDQIFSKKMRDSLAFENAFNNYVATNSDDTDTDTDTSTPAVATPAVADTGSSSGGYDGGNDSGGYNAGNSGYNAGDGGYGSGNVGYDAGDMAHGGLAYEDMPAVNAASVVNNGSNSDTMAAEANLSSDPMQALMDALTFNNAFENYADGFDVGMPDGDFGGSSNADGFDVGMPDGDFGGSSNAGGFDGGYDSGYGGYGMGYAHGGKVTKNRLIGPDPKGPDEGFGALKSGEFVLNEKSSKEIGYEVLRRLNARK